MKKVKCGPTLKVTFNRPSFSAAAISRYCSSSMNLATGLFRRCRTVPYVWKGFSTDSPLSVGAARKVSQSSSASVGLQAIKWQVFRRQVGRTADDVVLTPLHTAGLTNWAHACQKAVQSGHLQKGGQKFSGSSFCPQRPQGVRQHPL